MQDHDGQGKYLTLGQLFAILLMYREILLQVKWEDSFFQPPPTIFRLFLLKVDQFLDQLVNYDKENIHESNLKAVQPYLDDPEFEPDFIRSKSGAAAGICAWCINIIKFYHVFCDVEPKRQALAAANAELAAAEEKLSKIKAKINELDENLAELTASFEKVIK